MAIDITISEVGPRDGLQSIQQIMPTEAKKTWIRAQFEAGTPEIEVGSFVPPKLLPQMADSAEIVDFAIGLEGLVVAALVPNLKGLENAVAAGAPKDIIGLIDQPSIDLTHGLMAHPETNLILATGHDMLGMTHSLVTGKLVSEIIDGKKPSIDLNPFRLSRF